MRTRTRITSDAGFPSRCTLRCENEYGEIESRDFFTPADGGYVRENWDNPTQVCGRLSNRGYTLEWRPSVKFPTLAAMVRREHRAAQRAMKREYAV